jgi:hypothetical protein
MPVAPGIILVAPGMTLVASEGVPVASGVIVEASEMVSVAPGMTLVASGMVQVAPKVILEASGTARRAGIAWEMFGGVGRLPRFFVQRRGFGIWGFGDGGAGPLETPVQVDPTKV